jgi:hypothetical protein
MEYVYRLNLPRLVDVLKHPDMANELLSVDNKIVKVVHTKEFFNNQILNLKNLNWSNGTCSCFNRLPNVEGPIHIDGQKKGFSIWGINWIEGGTGGMRYWENINELKPSYTIDSGSKIASNYAMSTPADKTYTTESGCAYLVNASIPHNGFTTADAKENRFAISIRCPEVFASWESVVNLFSDLIVV